MPDGEDLPPPPQVDDWNTTQTEAYGTSALPSQGYGGGSGEPQCRVLFDYGASIGVARSMTLGLRWRQTRNARTS